MGLDESLGHFSLGEYYYAKFPEVIAMSRRLFIEDKLEEFYSRCRASSEIKYWIKRDWNKYFVSVRKRNRKMLDEKYTKKKNKKTKSQFTGLRKRAIHPTDTLPSSPNFPDPSTSPQKWPPLVEKKKRSTHFSLNFLPLEKRFKRYVYIYMYIYVKKRKERRAARNFPLVPR